MKLTITLEPDEEGGFVAECVEIPGAISQGKSQKEAVDNVIDAIRMVIEVRREQAKDSHSTLKTVEIAA